MLIETLFFTWRFIFGFFFAAIPWYIGAFILLCSRVDYREKPGLIACTIAVSKYNYRTIFTVGKSFLTHLKMKIWNILCYKNPNMWFFCTIFPFIYKNCIANPHFAMEWKCVTCRLFIYSTKMKHYENNAG